MILSKLYIRIILILAVLSVIFFQFKTIKGLEKDLSKAKQNESSLLNGVSKYKTKDSNSVASVQVLKLDESQFKEHFSEINSIVKSLNIKNRDLVAVIASQSEMIKNFKPIVYDTIIGIDTVKCAKYSDKWLSVDICNGSGKISAIDSLILSQTIKRKRFLGFLWKTNKIIDKKIDVVSKNPNVEIKNVQFIEIEN
ncbi:hypothetical protein D3C86_1031780 [compost metagenome]